MTGPLGPMIPTMRLRAVVHLFPAILLAGCVVPEPGPEVPLDEGLRMFGEVAFVRPQTPNTGLPHLQVVLIRDRHVVHGTITWERGPLRDIRRDNRHAIGFLIRKGFALLGCEASRGPLPDDDGPSAAHRAAVRDALARGDRLHDLTVYQPIRYEEEFRDVLTVLGMEDPTLYKADAERLGQILEVRPLIGRADIPEGTRNEAARTMLTHMKAISANVDARGRAAACNLIEHMLVEGNDRAMLLLGGAHAAGALAAFRDQGVTVRVFQCKSYARR